MMKKLLALVLVLAMAQWASAVTMEVLVDGEPWDGGSVEPSDYITLMLVTTPGTTPQPIGVGSSVTVSDGDLQANWILPGYFGNWPQITDPLGRGFSIGGNATWMPGTVTADGIFVTIEFHVPDDMQSSDYIAIDWVGMYGAEPLEQLSGVIHVVPEPTTIALLGLGGLCLLRRRRK
jgi:hypothetical protein